MYGFICNDGKYEWWIRRKEKTNSEIVISQEEVAFINDEKKVIWIRQCEIDFVLSLYCKCPIMVKEAAKNLKSELLKL